MSEQEELVSRDSTQSAASAGLERSLQEVSTTMEMLRTETDRVRGLSGALGFGRRILVPPDEIHVVVGDGRHSVLPSKQRKVFGQTADRPSYYWLNSLTQVIKLKTISFTVQIRGANDQGVEALDSSKVSFQIWAHAVAKLNPEKADIASQRVGLDTTSLINTITEVGTAELVAAAATMSLQDIIASRQKLAEIAFPQVNQILSELGYDLALLTITNLDGMAYRKLVEQAEARVSKETSIATNLEQVAELQDDQARKRTEAEIQAETKKKLSSEELEAQREVEVNTLSQQEVLAVRRHELHIKQIDREKAEADTSHHKELAKVQLAQQLAQEQTENEAKIARIKAERAAELRSLQQKRNAQIQLQETEADAARLAVEQAREIERHAEQTQAEAKRLREEELAQAERAKEVALMEAAQVAEAMNLDAEAEARAMKTRVDAETNAELVKAEADAQAMKTRVDAETNAELIKAEAEANATEKRARAAKVRAEATRAESAAPGLASAEVAEAEVQVAEKRVVVTRAEGLAEAEIARAQAEAETERLQRLKEVEINAEKELKAVEIKAKKELVALYEQSPAMVELEKMRVQLEHDEKVMTLQMDAYVKAFQALAPGVKVHIYGNGGQASQLITDVLSLSQGLNHLGDEVPVVGKWLEGRGRGWNGKLPEQLGRFVPYLKEVVSEVNPRMLSSLKVADVVERLGPVLTGQDDMLSALTNLKEDASFKVIGNMPISPLLNLVGITLPENGGAADEAEQVVEGEKIEPVPIVEEEPAAKDDELDPAA